MKIKISKSQWECVGKKAGWIKKAQGRMNRGEEEMYPSTGKGSVVPDDGFADGGTPYTSEEMDLIGKQDNTKAEVQRIKDEVAKVVDEYADNLLSKEGMESRMKELIEKMYSVKGVQPNPNLE